ncbi:MAG: Do family serine endopeptidase [Deltaproteobacteria bacterium]|nr:Do family serine endopeptidase [Deltaproteobacteria bacterium]
MKTFFRCLFSILLFFLMMFAVGACRQETVPQERPQNNALAEKPVLKPAMELLETQKAFVEVSQRVIPSVVNIRAARKVKTDQFGKLFDEFFGDLFKDRRRPPERQEQSLGSGFIISREGHILTNTHVFQGAEEIRVKLANQKIYHGTVVGFDTRTDVAVLKIDIDESFPAPVVLGDSDRLQVGQWALAIGNPFGLEGTLTVGVISATKRSNMGIEEYEDFIQTDASINPGNSGGPLVNIYGEVVGINTAIVASGQGIGFAIPINLARLIADQLIANGKVERGWLGVRIQALTVDLASSFGIEKKQGVLVSGIISNSPAKEAGVLRGDIILSIDGKAVADVGEFKLLVANIPAGKEVLLVVWRQGASKNLKVKIANRGDISEASNSTLKSFHLGMTLVPHEKRSGLVVSDIDPESPAASFGVREGDILLALNKKKLETLKDFEDAYKNNSGTVSILLKRGSTTLYLAFPVSKP